MYKIFKIALIIFLASLLLISFNTHVNGNADKHSPYANSPQKSILIINLTEEINPGSSNMFRRELSNINSSHVSAVIINMNTPGGILANMISMVQYINNTEAKGIPVYTYIPPDSLGASAGSYVAMASTSIYMGKGSEIGPSTPIVVGGTSLEQKHTTDAMESFMTAMANAHNRNATAAFNMVSNNTAYNETQAVKNGVVNGYSPSLNAFINSENLSSYNRIYANENAYDQFLSFLSDPTIDGIFILLGIVAIFLDFYHGTVLLSITGIVLIVLGLLGAEIIGASIVGLIFLLMAAVLILLEFKTNHGIALLSGLITGIVGIYFLASSYDTANPGYSPSPFGICFYISAIIIVILGIILVLYIHKILKSFLKKRFTGAESIIGGTGESRSNITKGSTGFISIEGIEWEAVNVGMDEINKDDRVTIIGRDGIKLLVKKKK